jgi:catechol 2,3-dioxygenase-like lactoylglutathione lyase family enzyme
MRLRSVELKVPQAAKAAEFLEQKWGLAPAGSAGGARFLRGTGEHPYILSVAESSVPGVAAVTFSGPPEELDQVKAKAKKSGAPVTEVSAFDVPGGGHGFAVEGPEGQVYHFIGEPSPAAPLQQDRARPIQLSHAVINSLSREQCERFAVEALGFQVSDRTKHMTFVRCNRKHHCVAYAHSDASSLNHIAFEMQDIDAVMQGFGRMRDAGIEPVWGPGRHGPGNNVFGYFIAPFGAVIEYTAEVSEVGDDYKVGSPEDWTWPAGRIDHWGASRKDMARIGPAERAFRFTK